MDSRNYGWTGKVLHIDLSTHAFTVLHPAKSIYRKYLGGRGLAGYYLRPFCTRECDDPELPLLLFTGPLSGTLAPASGRGTVMSRSPLTGGVCDCSIGGKLPTQLKKAGWDGLIITGHSSTPCGIEILDNTIQIVPTDLWGSPTDDVFDSFDRHVSIATIGPAAEHGSPLASLVIDRHHAANRGGLGLICAKKNLKYLAVSGTGSPNVHDPKALEEAKEDIQRLTAASPFLLGQHGISNWGTAAIYDVIDSRRMMPTDNFQSTRFPHASKLNASSFHACYTPEKHGCDGCHIQCKRVAVAQTTMPEYDAMAHFTALIGNKDMESVVLANALCTQIGIDPISAGATLACYSEITDTHFTPASLLAMLRQMGEGHFLSKGSLDYAHSCGQADQSMSVKGMELPAYDPRGAYGLALAYAVNTRGGCHLHANPITHEIFRKPVATDRFTFSGKARIIKISEDILATVDSLAVCKHIVSAASLEEYAKAYTAVTGHPVSGGDLLSIGERINYNERIMNAANGFQTCDDDLPPRFFTEEGSSGGGVRIKPLDRDAFLTARAHYYAVRDLDEHGRPTPEAIRRLDLDDEDIS